MHKKKNDTKNVNVQYMSFPISRFGVVASDWVLSMGQIELFGIWTVHFNI